MMNEKRSKVMTIANSLVTKGYNRSQAMFEAWAIVKSASLTTSVAGVTFNRRQEAIQHLSRYRHSLLFTKM